MEQYEILEMLDNKKGMSLKALCKKLNIDQRTLSLQLENLENDLKIVRKKSGEYIKTENDEYMTGRLEMTTRGFGFLISDDGEKVFIHKKNLGSALDGDRILIQVHRSTDDRLCGEVLKVKSKQQKHVGLVFERKGQYYVKLDNRKFPFLVKLHNLKGAYIDNKVVVNLTSGLENGYYNGEVTEVIGHKNDPRMDVLSVMKELGIPDQFSSKVMKEVEQIGTFVTEDEIKGRLDLRDEVIVTIDGDTAKDFDDAISIKKLPNGNYKLGVHIADVSHYVKEGSTLDKEAFIRGTSVYTPGYVTPMLPAKLSNGICSLNPNVDRLTLSCIMEINPMGEVVECDIEQSVINSHKRMTYAEVNNVLKGEAKADYIEYIPMLKLMLELSTILNDRKEKLGSINFDAGEMIIDVNEMGEPINITKYDRGDAEKIIENFMITANETVTNYAKNLQLPFIYRVHEEPDKEKLEEFINTAGIMGFKIDIPLNRGPITSKQVQMQLEKYRDDSNFQILSNLLLRSMKKAEYSNSNSHHFGLALRDYTHFTSPIRRYPDLTVHRALKSLCRGEYDYTEFNNIEKKYRKIAEQSSICEQRSVECEREVEKMKCAEYLSDKIGEVYDGQITSIKTDRKKIYVQLGNLIHGVVNGEEENYNFEKEKIRFTSVNEKIYTLGSDVKLKLIKADKENRDIEFRILEDEETVKEPVKSLSIHGKTGTKH